MPFQAPNTYVLHSGVHPWKDDPITRTVHLVFTPKNRISIFENEKYATEILRMLGQVAKRHTIVIHEACAMPDHVHLLMSFDRSRNLERDITKKIKGASARAFLTVYKQNLSHLWGEGKHFEDIGSQEQFNTVLRYIQNNPIQASISTKGRMLSQLRMDAILSPDQEE